MKVLEGTFIELKLSSFLWMYTGEWEKQHNGEVEYC
jgi:hypothetical protein